MMDRWYSRYLLPCRDVRDLLVERGGHVDASTINKWVIQFAPEIAKRSHKRIGGRGLCWQADEIYIRFGGKWRYLWCAVDQFAQVIDFRLTARRDMGAARTFFRRARKTIHIYAPVIITTDTAPTYPRIISEMNVFSFPGDEIIQISRKGQTNLH